MIEWKSEKENSILNNNDTLSVEAFAAAYARIKNPEIRASIAALVLRLAEASEGGAFPPGRPRLQS